MLKLFVLTCILALAMGARIHLNELKFKIRSQSERIVGGVEITIEEAPFTVQMQYLSNDLHCGGSIANANHVITAGHCVDGFNVPNSFHIRSGTRDTTGGETHNITNVALHPQYNAFLIDYDVAILTVDPPFVFGPKTQPIELIKTEPADGEMVTITGWGTQWSGAPTTSPILRKVEVPVISRAKCREAYDDESVTERMICAAYKEGGHDHCNGDSGGPVFIDAKLAGTVSWAYGCADPLYPGVSSNVANLRSWIEQNLV